MNYFIKDRRKPSNKNIKSSSLSQQAIKKPLQFSLESLKKPFHLQPLNSINDLFKSCESLQKDISSTHTELTHLSNLKDQLTLSNNFSEKIRNDLYKDGIRRIESRLKKRKRDDPSHSIKNLTKPFQSSQIRQNSLIQLDDLISEKAVNYLACNKRQFGSLTKRIPSNPSKKKSSKNKEILINPRQTIYQDYLCLYNKPKPQINAKKITQKSLSPEIGQKYSKLLKKIF